MKFQLLLFFGALIFGAIQDKPSTKEIEVILGDKWTGDLVYLDYSANKEVAIPVEILIKKIKTGKYSFQYNYPKEPKANSTSKILIDLEQMTISKAAITDYQRGDGLLTLKTSSSGKDNGKPAEFLRTYVLGVKKLIIRKEVRYKDGDEVFMRNEYRMSR